LNIAKNLDVIKANYYRATSLTFVTCDWDLTSIIRDVTGVRPGVINNSVIEVKPQNYRIYMLTTEITALLVFCKQLIMTLSI
jgi:hypothetical protein